MTTRIRACLATLGPIALLACGPPVVTRTATPTKPAVAAVVHKTPAEIAAGSTPAVVLVRTASGMGTGFIVDKHGLVATSLHVIRGSRDVVVELLDHRFYPVVEVVSQNRRADLAVIRIKAEDLPMVTIGDSESLHAGDSVVAIGHPLGLEDTVSNGLISGIRTSPEGFTFLQMSAPIAPGSSGGPIFNDQGEVVGVCEAIMRSGQNLNFGTPAKYLKALLDAPDPLSMEDFAAKTGAEAAGGGTPAITRQIPHHPTTLLDGCDGPSVDLLVRTLGEAIDVGAPLYNGGNVAGCYHLYEGAAADLEHRLPRTCGSVITALAAGRQRAAGLSTAIAQAWAMRDAFDGLLDVVVRKRHPLTPATPGTPRPSP